MKFLLVLSLVVVGSFATLLGGNIPDIELRGMWKDFKTEYKKTYENEAHEERAFNTFVRNAKKIYAWNANPQGNYTLGINQFTDLTAEEFKMAVHGHTGSCLLEHGAPTQTYDPSKAFINVPQSVDWQARGKVTPVKNQGQCGSCWSFSTTGSIESRYAISTGDLVSLSEQELVDCSRSYGNNGCRGGLMDYAFKYVEAHGGLCSEEEYPYEAKDGQCRASQCTKKYDPIRSYVDVQRDNVMSLESAVAQGPVSIAIEADQFSFQYYKSGVLSGSCGTRLDHGVLVVGYGTLDGQDYWKVKNSWGPTWGVDGYVLVCRNCQKNNGQGECGILMEPSYPTV